MIHSFTRFIDIDHKSVEITVDEQCYAPSIGILTFRQYDYHSMNDRHRQLSMITGNSYVYLSQYHQRGWLFVIDEGPR